MAGTIEPIIEMIGAPLKDAVNGGTEGEFFLPVRPGDLLVSYMKLADLYERSGRAGRMLFVVLEDTFKNQRDQVVATIRHTLILY
jgi:hypothetical protein